MAEVQMTFRGTTFNSNTTGSGDTYMLIDIPEGLSAPEVRESEQPLQGQHGITDQVSYYGRRLITLTGVILSDTESGRVAMQSILQQIFALDGIQSDLNASYYTLYITNEAGTTFQIDVKVSVGVALTKIPGESGRRGFIVTLKARNVRFLSQTLDTENIDEYYAGTGFQVPFQSPFQLIPTEFNIKTITNDGNFSAQPIITITGPSENPRIKNNTTDQFIKINRTLTSTDTLEINTELGTITENGVDVISDLDTTSDMNFQLNPGANQIQLDDDTPDALFATGTIKYRDSYINI